MPRNVPPKAQKQVQLAALENADIAQIVDQLAAAEKLQRADIVRRAIRQYIQQAVVIQSQQMETAP